MSNPQVEHSAAKRLKQRQTEGVPLDHKPDLSSMASDRQNFDERAKANADRVSQIHEFRRKNIKSYDAPDENLFNYDQNENDMKYNALKAENIFRFNNTFKAIRWGVTVGGLFGMHRYYRSRDLSQALNWFCTISGLNFFTIWISYGLQDLVTAHSTNKSINNAAREEYHLNAYKRYIGKYQETVRYIDDNAEPVIRNTQSESMDLFVEGI